MKLSPDQILKDIWLLAILGGGISLVATPLVRWIAYRTNIVDRPDHFLKPHARPIAYMGGLAVCAGFLPSMIIGVFSWPHLLPLAVAIAGAAIIVIITGLLDDIWNLAPKYKLLGQIIAAGVLFSGLCTIGIHISAARMFTLALGIGYISPWIAIPFSAALTVVVLIVACNATNLLDGLDGLCGGVTGIIAVGFFFLTLFLACFGSHPGGIDQFRVVICLAMAGAVLGFLPYNVPPASIFLGDAGSMLLGFFVATMMMLFTLEGTLRWFLAAGVIFGLPIIDTALAVVRRILAGVNIFAGDRSHLYDQLVDRGMSVKKVVALFYLLAVAAGTLGVLQGKYLRARYGILLDVLVLAVITMIFAKKGMIIPKKDKVKPSALGGKDGVSPRAS